MTLPFAGDLVVAVLLVVTIVYAAMLNRRLAVLRSDKAELEALIQSLSTASHGAEAAVAALRSANEEIGRQLETKVERAQGLRDDLSYMIERGNTLADRLEGAIRARRDMPAPEAPAPRVEARGEPVAEERRASSGLPSRTERDLLRALAGRR